VEHAKRRLAQRLGDRELIHLFVVALLEIDDLALGILVKKPVIAAA
jgi:hypothetical protein